MSNKQKSVAIDAVSLWSILKGFNRMQQNESSSIWNLYHKYTCWMRVVLPSSKQNMWYKGFDKEVRLALVSGCTVIRPIRVTLKWKYSFQQLPTHHSSFVFHLISRVSDRAPLDMCSTFLSYATLIRKQSLDIACIYHKAFVTYGTWRCLDLPVLYK